MIATRFELHRLTSLDLNACSRPHFHHPVFHAHLVNLETTGNVRRTSDEFFRDRAGIGYRHVTAADWCAFWRRAYPGRRNFHTASGDIFGLRRGNGQSNKHGHEESKPEHLRSEEHTS